jgi:flagellar biosynthetic protein FliR
VLLAQLALTLARVLPITVLAPFLGGRTVPPLVRVGMAVSIAILALPHATLPRDAAWLEPYAYAGLLVGETARGLAIGFATTLVFWLAESAGRALDVARGANLAEVQAPGLGHRASPLGQFAFLLFLVVFCRLDGPAHFLSSIFESFRSIPVGAPVDASTPEALLRHAGELFGAVSGLVLPGLVAALLVDLVFGAFNRIAPALNAYFLALGGKALAVVGMLMVTLGVVVDRAPVLLARTLSFVAKLARGSE